MFNYNYFSVIMLIGGGFMMIAGAVTLAKVLRGSKSEFAIVMLMFSIMYGVMLIL
jgi:hypothetical protein